MTELLFNVTSVDTAANIWVAIGTISMAFVTAIMVVLTYFTLRSSKEQLEIQKKQFTFQEITFGKRQILDQIKLVIQPLRAELTFEIDKIKSSPVNFRTPNQFSCLKFPIPNSKIFFVPNKNTEIMTGQELALNHTIIDLQKIHPELLAKLENRYYIYLQIASKITNIEKELESDASKEQLENLVKTYCNPRYELTYPDHDYCEEVIEIDTYEEDMVDGELIQIPRSYPVPVYHFIKNIISLLFDEIWDIEQKNVSPVDEDIIHQSSKVRREFIETKKESEIWILKEEINNLLDELQSVDESLKTSIDDIISEYKEKYHLSAEQLA